LTQRRTGVSQQSVLAEIGKSVWGPAILTVPTNERSLLSVGRAAKKALKRIKKTRRINALIFSAPTANGWPYE
jgi:hypothetical protein